MNLSKDIFQYFSKDDDFHTLGEIIVAVGDTIPAEIATQIHAKDNVGAKMPLDEKVRAGRRRKVLNTLTSLCKNAVEEDLSPATLEAAKDTSLARRFRMVPSKKKKILEKYFGKASKKETLQEKPRRLPRHRPKSGEFDPTGASALLEQLKALYCSNLQGKELEDALRYLRELSRIRVGNEAAAGAEAMESKPDPVEPIPQSVLPILVPPDKIEETQEKTLAAVLAVEEPKPLESEQAHVGSQN